MGPNQSRLRLVLVTGLALGASACGDDTNDGDTGSDETTAADTTESAETGGECSTPTVLELTNNTGNAIEVIHFLACDISDGSDYPVPPPGLAHGETESFPFPGPGCWLLGYEGEGCYNGMNVMTDDLVCGDVYVWMPDDSDHICTG
jgi:hypothetical protein